MTSFLDEQIVNLGPLQNRTVLFKKCYLPCPDRCGDCRLCTKACPENCERGVDTGVGHVWRLSDELPGFLVAECIEIFRNKQRLMSTADGFVYFKKTISKLIRRSYPDLFPAEDKDAWEAWDERLHENLSIGDYPQILIHFLSPLAVLGGTTPAESTVPVPTTTTTPTTRKRKT